MTDLGIMALLAAAVVGISAIRWRWALYAALCTAVIEGAFRKWVLPDAGSFIYFAKDLLLAGAYLGFAIDGKPRRRSVIHGNVPLLMWICVGFLIFQLCNPNSRSFLMSVIGLKPYVFYLPLIFLTQYLFQSRSELEWFIRIYLVIALGVFLVGAFQFTQPVDSFWNQYAHETDYVSGFGVTGEYARITATFSYITGLTTYLMLAFGIGLPMLLFSSRKSWQIFFLVVLVLAVGNAFMSGSRAPVFGFGMLLFGFVGGTLWNGTPAEKRRLAWLPVLGAVAVLAAVTLFTQAAEAVKARAEEAAEEGEGRATAYFTAPWKYAQVGGMFGLGGGFTMPPTLALKNVLGLPDPKRQPPPLEVESTRVMVEVGWPTFILWHLFRLYLLYSIWRVRAQLRSPLLRQLALGILLANIYYIATGVVVNHLAGFWSFFLCGCALGLPCVDGPVAPHRGEGTTPSCRNSPRGKLRQLNQAEATPVSSRYRHEL